MPQNGLPPLSPLASRSPPCATSSCLVHVYPFDSRKPGGARHAEYVELHQKRYGKQMDHEERARKKSARECKKKSTMAQKVRLTPTHPVDVRAAEAWRRMGRRVWGTGSLGSTRPHTLHLA
jgi:hypothetical protein